MPPHRLPKPSRYLARQIVLPEMLYERVIEERYTAQGKN